MSVAKAPPFDPGRIPPASSDANELNRNDSSGILSVEEAHNWLGHAWAAFDRARNDAAHPLPTRDSGRPRLRVMRPACVESCSGCTLRCSMTVACLWSAYQDYQDALAAAGPVLSFSGAVYSVMAGRA